ncbi:FkbM family methyltransferase [Massilia cavernae]|uniref:FkbM family methyltransferase n=1 Tax=Massilia cavernae TaxID=2320864 RepID=A0A418XSX0_9BURK|nr:FkbM family methyltransferase [Massilia cavernae]RJG15723.1 FkbM family methyltransferase [Massilia cavernae]
MTFISYAQNFEDVLLWRALGNIKNGFYIDVGANDPVDHSVTKAFYDAGWSGINIEPLPSFHAEFERQRPRDTNLAIAAGAADGSLTLYDVPAVNGWASPDRAVAEAHHAKGFDVKELTVPVRTLAGVCAEHVRGDIHFLKVDVEGFEGEVLKGMDFVRWRPWVLVIEATQPDSRVTNHETWEALVTGRGYHYAHFDGLNRYYVADEHRELLEVLAIQPNVFDEFISHHLDKAWRKTERAESDAAMERHNAAQANEQRLEAEKRALAHANKLVEQIEATRADSERAQQWGRELEQRLLATLNSTSWRITSPLRKAGALLRRLREVPVGAKARGLTRSAVIGVTGNERMRRLLIPLMLRFPRLSAKVSLMLSAVKQAPVSNLAPSVANLSDEVRALPVSARNVLADLQRARRKTQ